MAVQKTKKHNQYTVLIVEDEAALADIYSTKLILSGYRVLSELDGIRGLATAISQLPDIILLDIMLPGKDGFEVLGDLKMNPTTEDIPVIILSNLAQAYEVNKGKKLGAEKFLTKINLTPQLVLQEVEEVLNKYKQQE